MEEHDEPSFQVDWNAFRAKLKEEWDVLGDEELNSFEGRLDELPAFIQDKTGTPPEIIQRRLLGMVGLPGDIGTPPDLFTRREEASDLPGDISTLPDL
ncbi:MAG: hypothetical protein ACE5G0_19725 [Rhodothermales bacterium]